MYGKFSIGYRMIPEMLWLYLNTTTLLGMMSMHLPMKIPFWELLVYPHQLLNPLPVTYASHIPTLSQKRKGLVQPISSEEARATYLKEHMKHMGVYDYPCIFHQRWRNHIYQQT